MAVPQSVFSHSEEQTTNFYFVAEEWKTIVGKVDWWNIHHLGRLVIVVGNYDDSNQEHHLIHLLLLIQHRQHPMHCNGQWHTNKKKKNLNKL